MIFDLVKDFADVLDAMPEGHSRRRILKLLDEAIRRDVHFIDRHPTTFFQCMWNTCWWYDCPEAEEHYRHRDDPNANVEVRNSIGLCSLLERWHRERVRGQTAFPWIRCLRPPPEPLSSNELVLAPTDLDYPERLSFSGDGSRIGGVVVNPTSYRPVSAQFQHSVKVWDAKSGRVIAKQDGGFRKTASHVMAWSSDGNWLAHELAVSDRHVALCVVNPTTGSEAVRFELKAPVKGIVFSPNDQRLAVALRGDIQIWDVRSQVLVKELGCPGSPNIAWSHDGDWLVAQTGGTTVRVFETATWRQQAMLELDGQLDQLAIPRLNPRIMCSIPQSIQVFAIPTGECLANHSRRRGRSFPLTEYTVLQ